MGIAINLSLIGYFKYADFFIINIDRFIGLSVPLQEITLPLAISFFTFQQIAYLVDAYSNRVEEYNFSSYVLFVSFFPQLIAGPIVHHKDVMSQFVSKKICRINPEDLVVGITCFMFGLFKKVVLADHVANYANPVFNSVANGEPTNLLVAWSGALAYTLQLYFDFSGYSDMALGSARIFGVTLPLNFNSPYKSVNIRDFWRRWHITLSNFLRDYLYIPLGGNRKGSIRQGLNLLITMLLGGLWHGAGWTFVFWGGLHGVYLVIHRWWERLEIIKQPKAKIGISLLSTVSLLITFISVVVSWVFFRAADMSSAFLLLGSMCGLHQIILPPPLEQYLGFLSKIGFQFQPVGTVGFAISEAAIWIFGLLLIAWFTPNTQQWLENYRPALDMKATKINSPISVFWKRLRWQPNNAWLIISVIVSVIAIYNISIDNEFIYFQF
ncbi:MAG: MBOAT family protein [Cyanobacteria bacterium P01_H01_bin.15]